MTLAIVLIALAVVLVLFLLGGFLGARRRDRSQDAHYLEHLRAADHALEEARASDRGWDREVMERAARVALDQSHPGRRFHRLELVLVDDRPGVEEDRARFEGADDQGTVSVVLTRGPKGTWRAESAS